MEFREFSAKTVDEAITKACLEFGVSSEKLEIQVIFEGSSGFFGLGAKPARIRVHKKEEILPEEPVVEKVIPVNEKKVVKEPVKEIKKEVKKEIKKEIKKENPKPQEEKKETAKPREEKKVVERSEEEIAAIKEDALKFLNGVFKAMELEVEMKMDYKDAEGNLDIEFLGEDMGILIGKRGQSR